MKKVLQAFVVLVFLLAAPHVAQNSMTPYELVHTFPVGRRLGEIRWQRDHYTGSSPTNIAFANGRQL